MKKKQRTSKKQRETYWATADLDTIGDEIREKFNTYQEWMNTSGYAERLRMNYNRYYGLDAKGSLALEKTDDGSITRISVNHHRNLLQHIHILVTQAKIAFISRARNSDYKSQVQTTLSNGILDYYSDEKNMSATFSKSVEGCLVWAEAFIECPWNMSVGEEIRPDEQGRVIRTGDQEFYVRSPFDVARDAAASEGSPWFIIRKRVNKWELAADHPQFAEEIIRTTSDESSHYDFKNASSFNGTDQEAEDLTDILVLYHERTSAVPKGRYTVICGEQVLEDRPLRYKKIPVFRLSAGDMLDSICGYSPGFSLLPIQQALDALFSAVVTNNVNHSLQNIFTRDPNFSIQKLNEGQNLITGSEPPTSLQLTHSSPETYKLIDVLQQQGQILTAINSTARGNPEASLKSGNSLALMLSTAIQFMAELQKNYALLASDVGSCVIQNIQQFASQPMVAAIGGRSKRSYVKSFVSDDVSEITRVTVDLGNPVSQTSAGRYELAQQWLQAGLIKTPQDFLSVVQTGSAESAIEDSFDENLLIRSENEQLRDGINPAVTLVDNHALHIQKHRSVFADPETRKDPKLMQAALDHIQEHINQMRMVPPDLAAIIQQQPLPSQQQQAPQGPQGQPQMAGVPIPVLPPNAPPEAQQAYDQQQQMVQQNPMTPQQ